VSEHALARSALKWRQSRKESRAPAEWGGYTRPFWAAAACVATPLLFATKNWHGPKEKEISGDPYGTKGGVVFRKGTSGTILQARQTTNLSVIGSGGMHNYRGMRGTKKSDG